jgi:hypothetical protein
MLLFLRHAETQDPRLALALGISSQSSRSSGPCSTTTGEVGA